ncbi:WD domain, G-beta repeat family protein [Clavispora lusitaniae]|uniref:WD domain, G-beta repeat family protein n=1 Tax=Clavispora lusitaniae TaxID=36911 RepID=UPI00202C12E3|nr:WD domain, G-beta repeat family protein [Clavispora lusitaniae]
MIAQTGLYPPHPATTRANSTFISYDAVNDRIAYASGKSIIILPLDRDSELKPVQFTKHTFPTTVATFSPSGNYVASGDESGQVKIWDSSVFGKDGNFEQPAVKSEFQILSGPIKSIAWDADNSRVIAVGQGKDKFGHCFTFDSGNSIGEIQGHSETINCVDIKPQRPYRAATVGDDKALVFFTGPPFKFDKSVRGNHTNTIRAVKFSPDGKWLVSVGSDRAIIVYDGKTGDFIKKIENGHEGGIFGVSWLPDSSGFVTCSADNTCKLWDAETQKEKHTYVVASPASVENQQVGVTVTKNHILTLSLNGNLNFFANDGKSPEKIVYGHQRAFTAAALTGESLVTGGSDGSLQQWKVAESKLDPTSKPFDEGHSNYISSISVGDKIYSAGWDDKLKSWKDGHVENSTELHGQPKQVVTVPDGVVVLFENQIAAYDSSLKFLTSFDLSFPSSCISAIPGTSKILVNNETTKTVEEFDTKPTIQHTGSYPALRATPTLIKVSPDGQYAAVAENTGKYTLYKTSDKSTVTTRWAFHNSKVNDASWTPDSKFIVSGGLDCGLFVYSVERPSKVLKFPLAHQTGVSSLVWLSYGDKSGAFVSTGLDGCVKTWSTDFSAY